MSAAPSRRWRGAQPPARGLHRPTAARRAGLPALRAAMGLAAALAGCDAGEPAARPPDVALLVLDTVRPDRLGLHGHPAPTSPRLDRLARHSVVFEDAQAPSPWTAPALASLLTGLYPDLHGVFRFPNPGRMDPGVETLAEILAARGYRTAAFTEGGYAKPAFGLEQGFDHYPANPGDERSHGSNLQHDSRIAANVDRAIAWLSERGDERFFLLFHTYEAHFPYRAPEDRIRLFWPGYRSRAEGAALGRIARRWSRGERLSAGEWDRLLLHHLHCQLRELPAVRERARLQGRVLGRIRAFEEGRLELPPQTLERVRALYDAELRFADEQIARLLDHLETRDGPLVLGVVSDHGEGLGEHRRLQHGTHLHDELTRVLFLLRAPGLEPRRVSALVRTVDWLPTVLELLGAPVPGAVQGRSLLPLLAGDDGPREAFASARSRRGEELRIRALRSHRWSYLHDRRTGRERLYDRRADPRERVDVAERHPDALARLRERLATLEEGMAGAAAGSATPEPMPADTAEELKALGYLE